MTPERARFARRLKVMAGRATAPFSRARMAGIPACLGLLALLWPGQAAAQPVTVIGGEHGAFTRIVLQSATPFDWTAEDSGDRITIAVAPRRLRVDRERVFARIPRSRLADLSHEDGGRLVLSLACPCPVRIVEDRPAVLVVDILDPPPGAATPPPQRQPGAAPPGTRRNPSLQQSAQRAGIALAAELAATARTAHSGTGGSSATAPPSVLPMAALISALTDAIERGVIEPAPEMAQTLPLTEDRAQTIAALPQNLRLRTPEEPAQGAGTDSRDPGGAHCPEPSRLAFLGVPVSEPFAATLGDLNQQLFGEFDQPDPDSTLALIRHYLAWGLGAEARLVLLNAPEGIPERDLLLATADVIEGRHSNARQRLAALLDCPGATALLAALAGAPVAQIPARLDTLLAAFHATPAGLRAAIGAQLIELLVAAEMLDGARQAREALARTDFVDRAELARLEALIETARGEDERAAQQLDAHGMQDAEALTLRFAIASARGEMLGLDWLEDAAALAASERGSESGRQLAEAIIRQHAMAGRLMAGFAQLDRFAGWLEPTQGANERVAALQAQLWTAALDLPDAEFVALILARRNWQDEAGDPDLASAPATHIAARLNGLGLGRLNAWPPVGPESPADIATARLQPEASVEAAPDPAGPGAAGMQAALVPQPAVPEVTGLPVATSRQDIRPLQANPSVPVVTTDPEPAQPHDPQPGTPEARPGQAGPDPLPEQPDPMTRSVAALSASERLRAELARQGLGAP